MKKILILFLAFCFLTCVCSGGCKSKNKKERKLAIPKAEATQQTPGGKQKNLFPPKPNSPPKVVSAEISPASAFVNTDLTVEVQADDPESDLINYKYQWVKAKAGDSLDKAENLDGEINPTLSRGKFSHGDAIAVKITPSDWYADGKTCQTKFIVVNNSPPEIISSPPDHIAGTLFTYPVKVKDLDNDPIFFSLGEGAPKGITIDSATGLITWDIPPNTTGTFTITVKADDGQEGICFQPVTLTVQAEQATPEEKKE